MSEETVKLKWPLKGFLRLKVNEADGRMMLRPSSPLFSGQLVQAKVRATRRESQGKHPGTSEGCFPVDVILPTSPLLPSVAEVLLCISCGK